MYGDLPENTKDKLKKAVKVVDTVMDTFSDKLEIARERKEDVSSRINQQYQKFTDAKQSVHDKFSDALAEAKDQVMEMLEDAREQVNEMWEERHEEAMDKFNQVKEAIEERHNQAKDE